MSERSTYQGDTNMCEELPKIFTLQQVAKLFNVSPHTVRSWVRNHRLQPLRICRRLLFDVVELRRFILGGYDNQVPVGYDAQDRQRGTL